MEDSQEEQVKGAIDTSGSPVEESPVKETPEKLPKAPTEPEELEKPEATTTSPPKKTATKAEPKKGSFAERLMQESKMEGRKSALKSTGSMPKLGQKIQREEESTKEEEPSYDHLGTDEFSEEQLKEVWEAYEKKLLDSGARDSQRMLLKHEYELVGNKIYLDLANDLQVDIMQRIHIDLVSFLRQKLNNKLIEVEPRISEEERKDMLYTNTEKLEYMMKINPSLRKLKDQLGLDPEF